MFNVYNALHLRVVQSLYCGRSQEAKGGGTDSPEDHWLPDTLPTVPYTTVPSRVVQDEPFQTG